MKTSALLVSALAIAFAAFAGVAYAQDPAKGETNYNRRQVDDNILTSSKGFAKAEREIDDTLPSGKPPRDFDEDAMKPGKKLNKSGRAVNSDRVKIRKKPLDE